MNNDFPVNARNEYEFDKNNIKSASQEWSRNKRKLGEGFYAYNNNKKQMPHYVIKV